MTENYARRRGQRNTTSVGFGGMRKSRAEQDWDTLGIQSWRIARLFELGILPEPQRIGNRRLIPKSMVPRIVDALRERGWLPVSVTTEVQG